MIFKITLTLLALVVFNIILLIYSCNKVLRHQKPVNANELESPKVNNPKVISRTLPTSFISNELAPTGS